MRKSTRLDQKQAKVENDAQRDPRVKKSRLANRASKIATLDNGTMVETFKYLSYIQLAKNSLISKRFSNLIRTHRHILALLYVDGIYMNECHPVAIKIFNIELSPGEYNEWIVRNGYSKQISLEAGGKEHIQHSTNYVLSADYKQPNQCSNSITSAFCASAQLNHDNWPLFQHFVRLLTDPFIYISYLKLTPRIDVSFVNLLAGAMNSDYDRLRCGSMVLFSEMTTFDDNVLKFIGWIKDHVLCNEFRIYQQTDSDEYITNFDEEFLDLFMTGASCTSVINVRSCDIPKVIVDFVQKFMDLKSCDEYKMVESIRCYGADKAIEALKRNYANFIVKEKKAKVKFGALSKYLSASITTLERNCRLLQELFFILMNVKLVC